MFMLSFFKRSINCYVTEFKFSYLILNYIYELGINGFNPREAFNPLLNREAQVPEQRKC